MTDGRKPERPRRPALARAAAGVFLLLATQAGAQEAPPAEAPGLFGWIGDFLGQPAAAPPAAAPDAAAPAETAPASGAGGAPAPPATRDERLTVGTTLALDAAPPPPGTEGLPCLTKNRNATTFCVEPVDWPAAMAPLLWVSSHMYQGNQAVVRFDGDRATYIHALIPATGHGEVVAWYSERLGPPDSLWDRAVTQLGGGRDANPTAVWRATEPGTGETLVMEVRKIDDSRGGFPDPRNGAILLYRENAEPVFPQLSSVELMAMRVTDGPRPAGTLPEAVPRPADPVVQPRPPRQPDPEAPAAPSHHAEPLEFHGINPFDPSTPVGEPRPGADAAGEAVPQPDDAAMPDAASGATPAQPADAAEVANASPDEPEAEAEPGLLSQLGELLRAPEDAPSALGDGGAPAPAAPPAEAAVAPPPGQADPEPAAAPRHGFFTRLGNSFAPKPEPPPQPLAMTPALDNVALALGDAVTLGSVFTAAADSGASACTPAPSVRGVECRTRLGWPASVAAAFEAEAATRDASLAVRDGRVVRIVQPFPSGAFRRVIDHFRQRYGAPTIILAAAEAPPGDPTGGLQAASWRSRLADDSVIVLDVRRVAAASGETGNPLGTIRLYREEPEGQPGRQIGERRQP